jgi:hypothetical protein
MFRKERKDKTGGGVLTSEIPELDAEIVRAQIQQIGSKDIHILQPQDHAQMTSQSFKHQSKRACTTNVQVKIGGNFNLPGLDSKDVSPTWNSPYKTKLPPIRYIISFTYII